MRQFEEELTNAVTSSAVAAVHDLTAGRFAADIVGVAADLGLADQIQSAPKTAEEIAAAMDLHAPSLYRLLRALANFGIFAELADGSFAHTPMSETLRSDVSVLHARSCPLELSAVDEKGLGRARADRAPGRRNRLDPVIWVASA